MTRPLFLAVVAVLAVGCGTSTATTTTSAKPFTKASLLAGARAAIHAQHQLSGRVLWTNTVPAHPTVLGGPALADLRASAKGRRKQGIRIKPVSDRLYILTLTLSPTYTRATATIDDQEQLRPYNNKGKPLGRLIKLNEHARIQLRRIGTTSHFRVWQVTQTP